MMASKTISLSDDAYQRLKRLKRDRESFSDVMLRLTGRPDVMRFACSITSEFAEELERHSKDFRERFNRDAEPRTS